MKFGAAEPAPEPYCDAWPYPPALVDPLDTEETQDRSRAAFADWKRRCPDAWKAWKESLPL